MGQTDAIGLLQENLDEEKAADQKLSALAEGGINQRAADIAHPEENGNANGNGKPASRSKRRR